MTYYLKEYIYGKNRSARHIYTDDGETSSQLGWARDNGKWHRYKSPGSWKSRNWDKGFQKLSESELPLELRDTPEYVI